MTKIKICGIKDSLNLDVALDAGADYIGLMFYEPSPRNISISDAVALRAYRNANYVAVMVNPDDGLIDEVNNEIQPEYLQLHGDESVERVLEIKRNTGSKIIKAMPIAESDDVNKALAYKATADILLLDTKVRGSDVRGGSGISFDWSLLNGVDLPDSWMLSGGLNTENIRAAIKQTGAPMVDVSSGVEREKGVKDPALIASFIKAVRSE